ncbi:hypothetical protein CW751_13400 [Brumimicrobium salinarum]|uniref:Secretion system C-terminal sorting domain-containing protein n=1 Tax=Brumimicrobium salinarum TaxID=2058658 RepID=A0A2I0QZS3_9FLAO|nr:Omp28-related outer membrane protein [Brumimicrobium salinarum]PKR79819.1 hypothetical protein CW751_13400 [Brumimicrobium salinarum]
MKQIYFSALLMALSISGYSQTVTEQQTALVVKKTATWCNPCGTWGWDLFTDIWDQVGDETAILEMHNSSSSGLYSSDANAFYGLHEQESSTPVFYVNTINEVAYSSGGIYPSTTKTNVINAVNATNAQSPVVNSGFIHSISGTTIDISTKVKFFENTAGEYYLGVYITEDDVQANQSGISGTATHKRIMRASVTANIYGSLITNGAVSMGDEFTESFSFDLDASWNTDKIKIFTVIWKKNGSDYTYVNAHQTKGFLSNEKYSKEEINTKLYPNVSSGDQDIFLEVKGAMNEYVTIEVFNQVGKKINSVFNGKLDSNKDTFKINNSQSLSKGIYFVNITSGQRINKTLKMIVR